jgi:hypothetical protein
VRGFIHNSELPYLWYSRADIIVGCWQYEHMLLMTSSASAISKALTTPSVMAAISTAPQHLQHHQQQLEAVMAHLQAVMQTQMRAGPAGLQITSGTQLQQRVVAEVQVALHTARNATAGDADQAYFQLQQSLRGLVQWQTFVAPLLTSVLQLQGVTDRVLQSVRTQAAASRAAQRPALPSADTVWHSKDWEQRWQQQQQQCRPLWQQQRLRWEALNPQPQPQALPLWQWQGQLLQQQQWQQQWQQQQDYNFAQQWWQEEQRKQQQKRQQRRVHYGCIVCGRSLQDGPKRCVSLCSITSAAEQAVHSLTKPGHTTTLLCVQAVTHGAAAGCYA